ADQINRANVIHLHKVWEYHTHALDNRKPGSYSAAFETTSVLFRGLLYLSSPLNDVIALDPLTGAERWRTSPELDRLNEGYLITSRGVAVWDGGSSSPCGARIFIGTNDGRLLALDALTGRECQQFGGSGVVDLRAGLTGRARDFHITSAPTVLGNAVVVGSSVPDNIAVDMPVGTVRAFDARTGKP